MNQNTDNRNLTAKRDLPSSPNPSTSRLVRLKESLLSLVLPSSTCDSSHSRAPTENAERNSTLETQIIATSMIIELAFYGSCRRGLREHMPPRSLYGEVSYPSAKEYWQKVTNRDLIDIAEEFRRSAPFPEEIRPESFAEDLEGNIKTFLRVASKKDPTVLKRAIKLLPLYTHYCGATGDEVERSRTNPKTDVERLNKIFVGCPLPIVGILQVNLISTDRFGELEVTRHVDFNGTGEVSYTIGRDGVAYSISAKSGLSDLQGIFPDLTVADPRSVEFPSYSELIQAICTEGHDIKFDVMNKQVVNLPEYAPSGPKGFIYCSYEAQQSRLRGLPGRDMARMNSVMNSWSSQVRINVYLEAARSPDAQVRARATELLATYSRHSMPILREAIYDTDAAVAEIARRAVNASISS